MRNRKIIAASGIMLSILLIFTLVGVGLARSDDPPRNDTVGLTSNLSDFQIMQVGSNSLMSEVVSGLASRGAQVDQFSEIPPDRAFDQRTAVVIDDTWLASRADNPEFHAFLSQAVPSGARLVVIGGNTSKLLEALDNANVDKLLVTDTGIVRNPAYFNPPQVGFKIGSTADGQNYPSLLLSNSSYPDSLVEALVNWLTEQ